MTKSTVRIHDTSTNKIIERTITNDELAELAAENTAKAQEEIAKANQKDAILSRLGLTAEEAAILLS